METTSSYIIISGRNYLGRELSTSGHKRVEKSTRCASVCLFAGLLRWHWRYEHRQKKDRQHSGDGELAHDEQLRKKVSAIQMLLKVVQWSESMEAPLL